MFLVLKTKRERWLGSAQTTYMSFLKSGDLPDYTCAEKLHGGQRGVMPRYAHYPYIFVVESILAKRCVYTNGHILRYTKYGL